MQHAFQISRKIEYGTRAMLFLASLPDGMTTSFREIARQMSVPEEFLAKILKTLVKASLVRSTRGARGGYALARPASQISFLEVIEAVEGPVSVNVCMEKDHGGCVFTGNCTMFSVWQQGQAAMLDVYRSTRLDKLAMRSLTHRSPLVRLNAPDAEAKV
ncbi:MAG: Rrf2 family transcriptional regulator [Archangium gephyra]|uniref:Rrf2 family transcriptional regulator n=1 Tax=Archangium gephyra TaxID=48 RepID=A0A2W5TU63_9BACT|nr:MAG: Rrf2 family transcriptional regulator [Archangium gephyra]